LVTDPWNVETDILRNRTQIEMCVGVYGLLIGSGSWKVERGMLDRKYEFKGQVSYVIKTGESEGDSSSLLFSRIFRPIAGYTSQSCARPADVLFGPGLPRHAIRGLAF